MSAYNFAYLDEQTKRMIRRAILKGVAVPGYQVPFASREMPMPYGWGTGGVQVTAACLTPDDTLKVIDQGADDTTNAVSIRKFFQRTAGVAVTERTAEATVIQTRHRIPETPLTAGPAKFDFSEIGVSFKTGNEEFCVNGQGVLLEKFATELYNTHTHPSGGVPSEPLPPPNTSGRDEYVTDCEESS